MARFSSRRMRDSDWAKIRYFKPKIWGGSDNIPHPNLMGYEFMMWLDQVRHEAGVPMTITSSYRPAQYNITIGGAPDSAHCDVPCDCVDIGARPRPDDPNWNYSRWQIVFTARDLGCRRIGTYQDGSLHLDRTEDRRPAPRMWPVVKGMPT